MTYWVDDRQTQHSCLFLGARSGFQHLHAIAKGLWRDCFLIERRRRNLGFVSEERLPDGKISVVRFNDCRRCTTTTGVKRFPCDSRRLRSLVTGNALRFPFDVRLDDPSNHVVQIAGGIVPALEDPSLCRLATLPTP